MEDLGSVVMVLGANAATLAGAFLYWKRLLEDLRADVKDLTREVVKLRVKVARIEGESTNPGYRLEASDNGD